MNINCYLPQAQLYQTGEYSDCIDEILAAITDLREDKAYLIVGDMNTSTHNRRAFRRFRELLPTEDWSDSIEYTYSQNCKNGLVATKIDYVLAKNFPQHCLISCAAAKDLVTKGGHLAI